MMMSCSNATLTSFFLLIFFLKPCYFMRNNPIFLCPEIEKQSLLSFKQGLEDPENVMSSWDGEVNCCKWKGVVCNNLTGHVHRLRLRGLSGKISSSLLNLKHLIHLDLSLNEFGETIPSFIGSFKKLEYLNLSGAGFHGKIPHTFGNLSNLHTLDLGFLSYTDVNGSYHELVNLLEAESVEWLSRLSQLEYLNMNYVNMSKASNWAQVINSLPSLRLLHFQSCSLDFMAPLNHVNTTTSHLTFLDLSLNFQSLYFNSEFSVSIPRWIFQLSNLLSLDLSGNDLEGPIPSSSINATKLQYIDLSSNYINSSIPIWIFQLTNLLSLDLRFNKLKVPISSGSINATKLKYLDLSGNLINSSIPDWLYSCKDLEYVGLSESQLQGTVSNAIANLTSLDTLLLYSNQLSGKIPKEIASMCSLRTLYLSYNEFEGDISDSFGNMSECFLGALETISLSGNRLSGHLPDQFGEFKRIQFLDLSENSFSGAIPISLGKLSSLEYLSLYDNEFTGNLPATVGQLFNLKEFDFKDNKLEGIVSECHFVNLTELETFSASGNQLTLNVSSKWIPPLHLKTIGLGSWRLGVGNSLEIIPPWLNKLKNIEELDLSNTGISGGIPIWFNWDIQFLNLSHNHLHGEIPSIQSTHSRGQSIYLSANQFNGSLPRIGENVYNLDLSNNSFSGGISHFLCDMTHETYGLDLLLERNQLSGEMPDCWKKWPYLRYLNIGKNNMSGSISPSIGFLVYLESLNLFGNNFSGQIPFSMHKCKELVFINFGDNDLDGILPAWMGTSLANLQILILRSNKLSGNISSTICHLNSLQIMDLSNNQFSGRIPRCVYNLTAMATKQSLFEPSYGYGGGNPTLLGRALWESASVATKGTEMQYDTTLWLVRNIDLSMNNLSGDIPKELASLVELQTLNLSENQLTGSIPNNIGDMKQLESLDLSRNYLFGEIPNSFTLMSLLNHLNLSFNNLTGRIPKSTQLQSLDASSFIGNHLYGPPLTSNCSNCGTDEDKDGDEEDEGDESDEIEWFWVFLSSGYAMGLSAVCSALVLKKSWRDAYFGFMEEMWNKLYVYVHVKWARLKNPLAQNS